MNALSLFEKLAKFPLGKRLFSWAFCFKAPYFGTVKPYFAELRPGYCVAHIKKRRSVLNHIGTVHAIAMCNLAEATGGLCIEVTLPRNLRWIPKGMQVEYLKKATSDLKSICEIDADSLSAGINEVEVSILDKKDEKVFRAVIEMYVSEKGKKASLDS